MVDQYSFSSADDSRTKLAPVVCLAIDTASPICSVAISLDGEIRGLRSSTGRNASGTILAMIDACLVEAEIDLAEIDLLLGVRGPGSFTGLRVGMATLQGLRLALGVSTATWTTFEVLALLAPADSQPAIACVDALRGNWLTQSFAPGSPREALGQPRLRSTENLEAMSSAHLVGFGLSVLQSNSSLTASRTEPGPLARAAIDLLPVARPDFDPDHLTRPLYLQPPAVSRPVPAARRSRSHSKDS